MLRHRCDVHNLSTVVRQTGLQGDDIMQNRSAVYRGAAPAIFALFFAAVVGFWAYNLGFAHGIAQHLPPEARAYPWTYYRPWGGGPFVGLFFVLFWFAALRFFIGGGPWRRGWGGYYGGPRDVPPMFDEWHRRVHERDSSTPPPART
jgi:hypothetical protein